MISTFYILGFTLFGLGTGLYILFSAKLSQDLATGAIPVRKES
jgi:hypothetical protein